MSKYVRKRRIRKDRLYSSFNLQCIVAIMSNSTLNKAEIRSLEEQGFHPYKKRNCPSWGWFFQTCYVSDRENYYGQQWPLDELKSHLETSEKKKTAKAINDLADNRNHGVAKKQGFLSSSLPGGFDPVHYKPILIKRIIRHYVLLAKHLDAYWFKFSTDSGKLGQFTLLFIDKLPETVHSELKSEATWLKENSARVSKASADGEASDAQAENRIHDSLIKIALLI